VQEIDFENESLGLEIPSQRIWEGPLAALLARGQERWTRVRTLLQTVPLARLARFSLEELQGLAGLTLPEAKRVQAAFALGRAVERERHPKRPLLRKAQDVHVYLQPYLRGCNRERFLVLVLDVQNRLQGLHEVSKGTLTSSLVHPREVFAPAIVASAASILVVHNHPSGDPEPSQADRDVTRRLVRAGRLLGIPVLDHIICGHLAWRSLRECMDFEEGAHWAAETGASP